ncbi:hypothetical protein [Kineococcus rhizosphaerae]|uniref:Uncharacterized protein n=1 Tax=Kineococcus rhizosphaerae TaxID=559628 RepID=A0A2T0R841_9ACTN|nr:hypothetical protein [Kineococcus rhizosphaerae]PRY17326.1 hypothetical protein CLV37_102286 [Kineococcus rhizosphaerae]
MPAADAGPGAGDLRAPVPFWPGWTVLGVVLLLLAVVVLAWAVRRPRRPRPVAPAPPDPVTEPSPALTAAERRAAALRALAEVEREVRAGTLPARETGHRTAAALRLAATPAATAALAECLPWQFRPRPPQDPAPLLRAARAALEAEA